MLSVSFSIYGVVNDESVRYRKQINIVLLITRLHVLPKLNINLDGS